MVWNANLKGMRIKPSVTGSDFEVDLGKSTMRWTSANPAS
jgi:hypothetical protein